MEILDPNKNIWVQGENTKKSFFWHTNQIRQFLKKTKEKSSFFLIFTGPELPYDLTSISSAMVTSPDGMGVIIVGGQSSGQSEIRILESRFDGSKFLPWKAMDHELKYGRKGHVVIPIPNSITTCI